MRVVLLVVYALLTSLPFVQGVEIGLSLMVMEGSWIAPLIDLSMAAGLSLAYAAGQWLPYARLRRVLDDLRLARVCKMLDTVEPLLPAERLEALRGRAPKWLRPITSDYRCVLLAILVNLPGSAVLGGGGILFMAGLSRLFLPVQTVLALLVAVAPVPFAVWLLDFDLGAVLG